jgi:hypothetical protein
MKPMMPANITPLAFSTATNPATPVEVRVLVVSLILYPLAGSHGKNA